LWKYVLLLPTAILALGLPLALAPDIALHYYTPEHPAMQRDYEPAGHGSDAGPGAGEASSGPAAH
jgi:cytochrome c oxidase subunit 4